MNRYESHDLEDRALPFIYKERVERPKHGQFCSSNWHENPEILFVTEGAGRVCANSRVIDVSAGDVVIINANHLHAIAANDAPIRFRYLIVDRAFCLSNGFDSTKVDFRMQVSDARVRALLEQLERDYRLQGDYRTLAIRSTVLSLLLLLCREFSEPWTPGERHESSVSYVKSAIDFIRASFERDLSLEEVASHVGINKCYLSHEFHKYTGYPFVAYVNRTRCKKAQLLLTDGRLSIHEVGEKCGFSNRSYFARSFRRYVGMSPAEYRESLSRVQKEL